MTDPGTGLLPAGGGGSGVASDAQQAEMEAILRRGLAEGAVAVGFGSAYTPGANMAEIERMSFRGVPFAFVSLANGKIYRTYKECGATYQNC